ncbi:magnesium-dependent phosphatase 1-like [Diorhabda carinulata]|uniref:magnesium-dependent phosphatase 1-like n=1 Tax=Diorhabda carinulata TaxID=1163345 RepID=UPI0025A2A7D9|nr:magnesium-dependent phosphatase 1-like [Diorhabda carinulata]
MESKKLNLIVFDLDYTLWPFWVDTHVTPPFQKNASGHIVDRNNTKIECYPEVPEVLNELHNEGYTLAVASRTSEIKGAKQLIQLFGWDKYFKYLEIFPGQKTKHFNNIKSQSGVQYNEMIFFDDESRNIVDVGGIGVTSILVTDGVNRKIVEEGIRRFARKK